MATDQKHDAHMRPIGEWHGLARRDGLVCVLEADSVGDVAMIMATSNIGAVLVLRNDGTLSGIFTERDLMRLVGRTGTLPADQEVRETMTPNPWGVPRTARWRDVAEGMISRGFRHAVIYDEARAPVGIVSMRDILSILLPG